jgi:hypothetical protein
VHRHHHPRELTERIDALMVAVFMADPVERMERIGELVARDFVYISPQAVYDGAEGLSEAFSSYRHDAWRHTSLRRSTDVEGHHQQFRYAWQRREGETTVMEGWSFGSVHTDGTIARIVTFEGLVPGLHA